MTRRMEVIARTADDPDQPLLVATGQAREDWQRSRGEDTDQYTKSGNDPFSCGELADDCP